MTRDTELIYIHDPMCSWCWGFRPTFECLCDSLPEGVGVRRLLGGLAPDSDRPMPDELRTRLQATWRRIAERIPGTRFNHDFWHDCQPRRSTWPACRAVIAARHQDAQGESAMIDAIQRAYYLDARNPSDDDTLISLAHGIGLDRTRFAGELHAAETQAELDAEMAETRRIGADSFPSLRLRIGAAYWPVAVHYTDPAPMLETLQDLLAA
ncbi:MAG: DsbA family protein [Gammaproteobacteria bacterium]|nr:DsbA family protein [Gammaproteobacteria bacterium]